MTLKSRNVKMVEVEDWDKLVSDTYGRPYRFQQQGGCKPRGFFHLEIPSQYDVDEMNDEIPEIINGKIMGVKFKKWLERDPNQPVNGRTDWAINLWWERNFYPNIYIVANDLYKKGLIDAGEYSIDIDW
jgi:hypothetical protein